MRTYVYMWAYSVIHGRNILFTWDRHVVYSIWWNSFTLSLLILRCSQSKTQTLSGLSFQSVENAKEKTKTIKESLKLWFSSGGCCSCISLFCQCVSFHYSLPKPAEISVWLLFPVSLSRKDWQVHIRIWLRSTVLSYLKGMDILHITTFHFRVLG